MKQYQLLLFVLLVAGMECKSIDKRSLLRMLNTILGKDPQPVHLYGPGGQPYPYGGGYPPYGYPGLYEKTNNNNANSNSNSNTNNNMNYNSRRFINYDDTAEDALFSFNEVDTSRSLKNENDNENINHNVNQNHNYNTGLTSPNLLNYYPYDFNNMYYRKPSGLCI